MLKNMKKPEHKIEIRYELCFDDGHNNGFGFPCDVNGNVSEKLNPAAAENLEWCKAHPEKFVRFNEVIAHKINYVEPARGICACGETVVLENQYYGSCQCNRCKRWYNLYGQHILPPDQWETDPSDDEYY